VEHGLNLSQVEYFLTLLGVENIKSDVASGWVRASCPLAPWLHGRGRDNKPSFGIKVPEEDGKAPYFHCFACESSGRLPKLLHDLTQLSGDRLIDASNFLSQFELFDEEPDSNRRGPKRIRLDDKYASPLLTDREVKQNKAVPEECLLKYPLLAEKSDLNAHADALRWLAHTRGISLQSIAKFQLRLYVEPVLEEIGVIFPILSRDGEQVLDLWVRLISQKKFFRLTKDYTGSAVDYHAPNLWFGNHLYETSKPLVLVEGAIDALRLHTLGIKNVLASFGGPSREQVESLYAPAVYLGYDNDGENGAGAKYTKRLVDMLQVPAISVLPWEVVGIKDAGELKNEAQFIAVFNARTKILRSVKTKTTRVVKRDQAMAVLLSKKDGSFL
jgi:hypothetical protein